MGIGGAMLAARAIKQMAADMHQAIGNSMVRVRMGKPVVKDVPLLISALEINDPATREEARMWLAKLSGVDHGLDAAAWRSWWQAERPRLARKEADEAAAESLFAKLRNDIILGRWDHVHAALSRALRIRVTPQLLAERLEERKREFRIAYRDAKVTKTEPGRSAGTLEVDWGERGFEMDSLPLVREDGEWRFAEAPWADHLTRKVTEEPRLHYHPPGRRPLHKRASSTQALVMFFMLMGFMLAWPVCFAIGTFSLAVFAGLMLLGPAIGFLVWSFDGMARARHARRAVRRR